ncbi:MAG: hypothetical protein CBD02_02525 [Candidatus Pelagibacter sp. TMED142]|nr:MAG: hypothetical protein CBD02_02525 [Candidatus Pelagibacter sp. TMED142]
MHLDKSYEEKVYAGVLGKIIGVYLGRPFEQWSHELIMDTLGPIEYYVNDKVGKPLIVPDDDITGTFAFVRALSDYGNRFGISSKEIGQTWLNNIVEGETILWWGGVGNSTEHTAFQNLKNGLFAPESGSSKTNGKGVSEQIGAQIFIDGWAMVCPGDPEKAADLAKKAARVSHDGEAVYGAQVIAAIESLAFVENNLGTLLETAKKQIPGDSTIFQLISDIQTWHSLEPNWEDAHKRIISKYGYNKFPGGCHIVPNHALIIMALLYGNNNFQRSMMIVNTAGWDTDCNAGNLGCILGIKNGLGGLELGPDWRSPIKDIMYCPTAIGGETITDAVREGYKLINIARGLKGLAPVQPKNGARYHFEMPGSVQGWQIMEKSTSSGTTSLQNVTGHSSLGNRSLEVGFDLRGPNFMSEVFVDTFFPKDVKDFRGLKKEVFFSYNFLCCPLIYPGQRIVAKLKAPKNIDKNIRCRLFVQAYGQSDELFKRESEAQLTFPDQDLDFSWYPEVEDGNPISRIGLKIESDSNARGKVYLDSLNIVGQPKTSFKRPSHTARFERGKIYDPPLAEMWRNGWVQATQHWDKRDVKGASFKIGNDIGRGMILTGTPDWKDYKSKANINIVMAKSGGLAVRVQGLQRYYGLEITRHNSVRLIKVLEGLKILEEVDFQMQFDRTYSFSITVRENRIKGSIDGIELIHTDKVDPLLNGGIGLLVEDGTIFTERIDINI